LKGDELTTTAKRRSSDAPKLIHLLKGDLDWIVMKCLEKDRQRRYDTANGLAVDLKRHLDNEPVVARPPSTAYRFQKAWRRNKVVFAAGTAVAAALLLGIIISTWQMFAAKKAQRETEVAQRDAENQRVQAQQKQAEAEAERRRATQLAEDQRHQIYALDMYRAFQYLQSKNLELVHGLLEKHVPKQGQEDLRGFEWRYLWSRSRGDQIDTLTNLRGNVDAVAASADGRLLAYAMGGVVVIASQASPRAIRKEIPIAGVLSLSFSGDNRWLAGASGDKITVWDTSSWEEIQTFPESGFPVKFSFDGKWLAFRSANELRLVSTHDWKVIKFLPSLFQADWWFHRDSLEFSRDGANLIYPANTGYTAFFDLDTLEPVKKWDRLIPIATPIALTPDGRYLARAAGKAIQIWDLAAGKPIQTLDEHRAFVTGLEFTPDGRYLVSSSGDRTLNVWEAAPLFRHVKTLIGHTGEIWVMAVTPDSKRIVTAGIEGSMKFWELESETQPPEPSTLELHPIAFTADSTGLYALHTNPTNHNGALDLYLWNQETKTASLFGQVADNVGVLAKARGENWLSASAKSDSIAFGMTNGAVRVWDIRLRKLQPDLLVEKDLPVLAVAFHPSQNDVLATGTHSGSIKIWNLRSRELLNTVAGPRGSIKSLCFSPYDELLGISIGEGSRFEVINLKHQEIHFSLPGNFSAAQFSPDGKFLAVASELGKVFLYEVKTGALI